MEPLLVPSQCTQVKQNNCYKQRSLARGSRAKDVSLGSISPSKELGSRTAIVLILVQDVAVMKKVKEQAFPQWAEFSYPGPPIISQIEVIGVIVFPFHSQEPSS